MPVNLSQNRGLVGAFNSRLIYMKQHNILKNAFCHSTLKQTIAKEIFTVLASFWVFLLVSGSWSFINLLRIKARLISRSVFRISYICILSAFIHHVCLYLIIFITNEDIEKNRGPKPNSNSNICHWILNNISAYNFLKLSLLRAYITFHKFDVLCHQRLTSIHPFYMMMIIYKFQFIIYIGEVIFWMLNEEVFEFTIKFLFH